MADNPVRAREVEALSYLRDTIGARAPDYLTLEGEFAERPLDGEGRTWLFSFPLAVGAAAPGCETGPQPARHYVAVGETVANYFPAYGLTPDEAYSFHVGTRFMLVMAVERVAPELEPPHARAALRSFVENYAKGVAVQAEELAGLFRCDDGYFAVYRLRLDTGDVYCFGADCPPGFTRSAAHPPQMALRLHLGRVIRNEAREAADGSAST